MYTMLFAIETQQKSDKSVYIHICLRYFTGLEEYWWGLVIKLSSTNFCKTALWYQDSSQIKYVRYSDNDNTHRLFFYLFCLRTPSLSLSEISVCVSYKVVNKQVVLRVLLQFVVSYSISITPLVNILLSFFFSFT
jgi:hypothetical protein